jgi:hypothetical protein
VGYMKSLPTVEGAKSSSIFFYGAFYYHMKYLMDFRSLDNILSLGIFY